MQKSALVIFFVSLANLKLCFGIYESSFYSSCDFSPKTRWIQGSGAVIKSWVNSIVPYSKNRAQSKAKFSFDENMIIVAKVSNSKASWQKSGVRFNDGWIYEQMSRKGKKSRTYYIYPNFKLALYARMDSSFKMKWGKVVRITHYRCNAGLMELKFTSPQKNTPVYKFYERNDKQIAENMTQVDPIDNYNTYIAPSKELRNIDLGDSVFAKVDIPYGSLILTYNGFFDDVSKSIFFKNMTEEQEQERITYMLEFNSTHSLDLLPEYGDLKKYRASLGHKVNHHFTKTNALFSLHFNPRFGLTRSVVAQKQIRKGEEIFINYNYDLNSRGVPNWYRKLHRETYDPK